MKMMIILVLLLYFTHFDGAEGMATITSLGCDSANGLSSPLTIGREYTMYCTITRSNKPPVVVWTVDLPHAGLVILTVPENMSSGPSSNGFYASFVGSDANSITASLMFTATASCDQTLIVCQDTTGASLVRDECRIHSMTTISTSAGSASSVSTPSTSTRNGSTSMASIGLGTSSALTTTSQAISTTPFATSTVLPTPGERNNINIILIIVVASITIVIAILIISIGLLSFYICKKLLIFSKFKSYGDSHNPSNTASHVCDIIKPSVSAQSSDSVKLSTNVAYGQILGIHSEASHSTNITTSANAAYGQVSGTSNLSTNITTSANAAYGQVSGTSNHSTNITTSANAAYGQVSGTSNLSTNIATSANAAYGQVSGTSNLSTNITTSTNAAYGQVSGTSNHSTNITTSANAAYGQVSGSIENDEYI